MLGITPEDYSSSGEELEGNGDDDDMAKTDEDENTMETPLVHRLRPRTRSSFLKESSSEVDADAEDEYEETEAESPGPSRRLRSADRAPDSDLPMASVRRDSRHLPDRTAKRKAIEALKDFESDEDETMEIDGNVTSEDAVGDEELGDGEIS